MATWFLNGFANNFVRVLINEQQSYIFAHFIFRYIILKVFMKDEVTLRRSKYSFNVFLDNNIFKIEVKIIKGFL